MFSALRVLTNGVTTFVLAKDVTMIHIYYTRDELNDQTIRELCSFYASIDYCDHTFTKNCLDGFNSYPIWVLNGELIVHYEDNERCMQLFRPEPKPDYVKELLHELKYNPYIPERLPTAVQECKEQFNKKIKK